MNDKQTELSPKEKRVVFCVLLIVMGGLFLLILEGHGVF